LKHDVEREGVRVNQHSEISNQTFQRTSAKTSSSIRETRALRPARESPQAGRESDAAWVKRAFDDTWKDGEVTLTIDGL